jgi:cardiolipin synthase
MNWPNKITISRIILIPCFIMAVLYDRLNMALFIFILAAGSDALDGYLARVLGEKTQFGAIIDPIADKLLINSAFICFSLVQEIPTYLRMPIYVSLIIISRDVLIFMGAFVIYLLNGKMEVRPTVLGKITTVFQMLTVILLLVRFAYSSWVWNTAVVFTVISGLDYIRVWAKAINGKV